MKPVIVLLFLAAFSQIGRAKEATVPCSENGQLRATSELVRRGITRDDLLIRKDEKVEIRLNLCVQDTPIRKRFVSVSVHTQHGNFGRDFDGKSPHRMTRTMLPYAADSVLSDADIEEINSHLAAVLPKWLPEEEPNKALEPTRAPEGASGSP